MLTLDDADYEEVQTAAPKERAPVAVLGPGTGLGHAFLTWENGSYRVRASEGGHADFAPRTDVEWQLAERLRSLYGHASWERVVISRHGIGGTDPLCSRAMKIFISSLGALAGNLALTLESYGGVYIAGGIAPRIVSALRTGPFLDAFRAKGRMSELLEGIPLRVVLDDRVGLRGAARVATQGLRSIGSG